MEEIRVEFLESASPELSMPRRATNGSSCFDVFANLPEDAQASGVVVPAKEWRLIGTGLKFSMNIDLEVQVRSRSGMALKSGVAVLNSPGTIDSDYRGEIGVILINHSATDYVVRHGDAIAQLAFSRSLECEFVAVERLDETERGSAGFGSTDTT
ncbi:dUTP diphosphatase [Psychromarinibacter sp. C21-152]|uniref:dUTP diphosphatase n=1 Tax=Psychromarinibacter sediminicola TaxID=3033385 RepID=A0AAE3NXM4_9RHOB|nr:dUTP diphosphatase [Psychromarinibacter sediminicola]MDF0603856.1 dUTP diphosphatase [Psychromarinibacter sediminicola]